MLSSLPPQFTQEKLLVLFLPCLQLLPGSIDVLGGQKETDFRCGSVTMLPSNLLTPSTSHTTHSHTAQPHRNKLALRGDISWTIAETQLCLQGVEVSLQLNFLVCLRRLGDCSILAELLQTLLCVLEVSLRGAVLEPGKSLLDPLQELCVCVCSIIYSPWCICINQYYVQ